MIYEALDIVLEDEQNFRVRQLTVGKLYRVGYNKNPRKPAPMYDAYFRPIMKDGKPTKGFAFFKAIGGKQINKRPIYKVKDTEDKYATSKFLVITVSVD